MKLTGNTILITGGSSGIGLRLASEFSKLGNEIIITGRNKTKLAAAKKQLGKVTTILSDVSNPADIAKLYKQLSKEFPRLNVLINNAGIMLTTNLQNHNLKPAELTKEIDINVKGPIWMTDKFLPLLKKNANSAIVNVSSGLAFVPLSISPVYCATKAALHSYTVSLRFQLANTPVKVFELAPPATQTELLGEFNPEDMKGISVMSVEKMVEAFIKGFGADKYEICPGQSSQLRFMSRMAPGFIQKQLAKPVARMHKNM
jgi:uncharacterized oxidoreductase